MDRSTIFEFSEDGGAIEAMHFWAKPGVAPMRQDDVEALGWYLGRLRRGEIVRLASLEAMLPADAEVERDYVRKTATGRSGDRTLASAERAHLEAVLDECGWLINGPGHAAEKLDLHPNTVRFRMKKLDITRPSKPDTSKSS